MLNYWPLNNNWWGWTRICNVRSSSLLWSI